MIKLLILLLLFFVAYTLVSALMRSLTGGGRETPREKTSRGEDMVKDPVCGTFVPRGDSPSLTVRGETHYFCSAECREKFRKS